MIRNAAVVTGCDQRFVPGARALLKTVRRFHPEVPRFCIVPASDETAICAELGDLATVIPAPRRIRVIPDAMQPALLKLFAPLVPAETVTWLDCDMVMCGDSSEIWQVAPGEVLCVLDKATCIRDMISPDLWPLYNAQFPGLMDHRGFNGGFFAFRTAEWRDLPERYEAAFEAGRYPYHPKIWDQPFLNGLMRGQTRLLEHKYNSNNIYDFKIPRDVRIVHYTSTVKPWMGHFPKHEPAYYYWLRYGLGVEDPKSLFQARLRIGVNTPKRWVGRRIKRVLRRPH